MGRRKYTPEMHTFIREHVEGRTTKELTALVNEKFNLSLTEATMKSYKANYKLKSGTPRGRLKGSASELFPQSVIDYIRAHYKGTGPKAMAEELNGHFGTNYTQQQVKGYYSNHGLNSGLTGRFTKGHETHNKGRKGYYSPGAEKGWFRKGHDPHNKTPIGTVTKRGDGYLWEKVGPGPLDWRHKHRLVWEQAHGPIPDGYVIIFKDKNKENIDLDNLAMVEQGELSVLNKRGLITSDPELTETGILLAKVIKQQAKAKKRKNRSDKS